MKPNRILEDYIDALRVEMADLPAHERHVALQEIRQHLTQEIDRLRRLRPALSIDEAGIEATHAFGHPSEVGVAYGPGGGVVRKKSGHVLLSIGYFTRRGLRRTLRASRKALVWTFAIVAGLLILSVATGLVALYVFQDDLREAVPHTNYVKQERYSAKADVDTEKFDLPEDMKKAVISVRTFKSQATGCLTIRILDPDGAVRMDTTGNCDDIRHSSTVHRSGTWTIQYHFTAYSGSVEASAVSYLPAR